MWATLLKPLLDYRSFSKHVKNNCVHNKQDAFMSHQILSVGVRIQEVQSRDRPVRSLSRLWATKRVVISPAASAGSKNLK